MYDGEKKYWPNGQIAVNYATIEMWDKNGTQRKDRYLNHYDRNGNIQYVSNYDPDSEEELSDIPTLAFVDDDNDANTLPPQP